MEIQPRSSSTSHTLSFMDPALAPWVLVSEVYWMSYKLLERRFHSLGILPSQARVLLVLHYSTGPIRLSRVATLLFEETQRVTGIIERIRSRGWVERKPNPDDRRSVGFELTDEGRKVAEEIVQISHALYDELFKGALTKTERHQVEIALRKVRAIGFKLPETDVKLRRAEQYAIWND
jgi:DNA-binding MarR family transcriptional regulator